MNLRNLLTSKTVRLCLGLSLLGAQASALFAMPPKPDHHEGGQAASASSSSAAPASSSSSAAAAASSSSAAGMPYAVPADIDFFDTDLGAAKFALTPARNSLGVMSSVGVNVKIKIMNKERLQGRYDALSGFSLGSRPAVRGRYIAVGTDNPEATKNFLIILDADVMLGHLRDGDPVYCYTPINNGGLDLVHLSDVKWLNATTLLACCGKGHLKLFQFDPQARTVKHIGDMKDASGSYIREMAVQPGTAHNIVIGGFDQKLNFLNLNKHDNPYVQRLDMQSVISSVKWSHYNCAAYLGCCLDEGKFYLFDARDKITEAAFYIDLRKDDLFIHERYNDFNVVFGFGDGELKHVDMRKANNVLHTFQDPFVEAQGSIEYDQESNSLLTAGYTDFSVFRAGADELVNGKLKIRAKLIAHSHEGAGLMRGKGWQCASAWFNPSTVVTSDNEGTVFMHCLDKGANPQQ